MRLIILPLDAVCAAALLPLAVLLLAWNRTAPRRTAGQGSLFHLSGGSSTAQVIQKFGSLDVLFETTPGTEAFASNVLFWFPSRASLTKRLDNSWTILEQRAAFSVLPLAGIALYFIRAARAIRRHDVRAIRAWDATYSGFAGWVLARTARLPLAVSIHADYDKRFELAGAAGATRVFGSREWAKRMERFVLRHADLVMPIRSTLMDKVLDAGVARSRVHLIPHGLDLTPFEAPPDESLREKLGVAADRKIISFAGRLSDENYVDDILHMARTLAAQRDDFTVVLAGEGPTETRVRETIAGDKALVRCAVAVGRLSHEEVIALRGLSALSLCLMGGFSLIEACAAGRPVIAYDVEWHGELVRDGETGFLLREGDTAGLVDAAGRLLDDEVLAASFGAAARELAFANHSLESTTEIKRQAYAKLLAAGAR